MISSAQNLPPKPSMPPAAMPAPATPAAGPSFAQFLTDQSAPPTVPDEGDGAATNSEATDEGDATTRNTAASRRAGQPRPAAPQRTPDAAAKVATSADKADTRRAADVKATDADDQDAETPELAEFTQLIGLAPAPAVPAPVAADVATTALPASADAAARERADGRRLALGDSARAIDTADKSQAGVDPRADIKPAARTAPQATATESLQTAAVETAATSPTATRQEGAAPSFATLLAQSLPAPVVRTDVQPAPVPQAAVQAPLHSPAFASEMSARVSLLAVDGVQRAELQLNPAEMGPVTVEIVVDGSQAQVSFQAVQAETRQVLEQCLPDLAAALQGQGLTLSGGGVFQQNAGDNSHGDGQQAATGVGDDGHGEQAGRSGEPATVATPARRSVGLLDAFA
jgi:flagellar hook-length control protein FliK